MLHLIEFILKLFTNPVEVIVSFFILGLMIVGIKLFANRSTSRSQLDAAPEVILRHRLKFVDEDLERNHSGTISPKQIKRIRKEFLILLIVDMALVVFVGLIVSPTFWDGMFRRDLDLISLGLLSCMGLAFLVVMAIAVFHLWGYIKDLRTKRAVAVLSPLLFEEHEGEYMGFKFQTHRYKIIVHDPRLPKLLPLHIGFMSKDVWSQAQKLSHQTAILYIAPNTSKLLSFELVTIKPDLSQKDVN